MSTHERPLTDAEKDALRPEIEAALAALREYHRASQSLQRLLALVEPRIAEPESGVTFDLGRSVVVYRDGND